MAKRTVHHTVGRDNRARLVSDHGLPKGMRGVDPESDVHTFKEGPIARWIGRKR